MQPGDRIGDYEILGTLGHGGMGTVYRARHVVTHRPVALKVPFRHLCDDPQFRERFRREARSLARVDHPAIVDIFDARDLPDTMCIAMRLLDGGTLADRLRGGPLPLAEVLRILRPIAEGIDAIHAEGLLHRDIKPSNIMFDKRGRVVLGDFGVAKREGAARLTQAEQVVGTVAYASPEQLRGDPVDGRSDVYALAVVIHEALAGSHPFERDTDAAVLLAHLQDPPPRIDGALDDRVNDVLARALSKLPSERPSTALQLIEELERASTGDDVPVVLLRPRGSG
jgi:serine/threonine protein kinase